MSEDDRPPQGLELPPDLDRRLARVVRRARWVAVFEEVWRRLVPIAWVGGLYVALAWLGVFGAVPGVVRVVLLAGLVGLLLAAVVAAVRDRAALSTAAGEAATIRRVETASALGGHELSGLLDRPAMHDDPATTRLWAAHRARLAARVGMLASGRPHPDLPRRDRFALRPLLGLALFVGWFAAGDERLVRLGAPFAGRPVAVAEDRLDAWIDPPGYTGRPPTVLIAEGRRLVGTEGPQSVPQGSRLVVRVASGQVGQPPRPSVLTVTPAGGTERAIEPAPMPEGAPPSGAVERVATLTGDAGARLTRGGETIARWIFTVQPDAPPTIRLVGRPETQASGALKLAHETGDDWGVVSAEAHFASVAAAKGRPLFDPPSFPLALPLGRGHIGAATTIRDLTAHPFAGGSMRMTLRVRDEAGQEGASEAVEIRLPERPFRTPLARALMELRRRLALDAGEASVVSTALDALTLAPERFEVRSGVHLGLGFVARKAATAGSDEALREVVDLLWVAATTLEDGELADREKVLRAAQEALRKALEEGASPEEIARLTKDLRAAMEAFLAAKAEAARRHPPQRRGEASGPQKTITDRDLQRMLDRIEALARTGSREAAEKLLQELRELMENLQAGAPGEGGDQAGGEALEKLGDMIRRQQKLMEDTHRADRGDGAEESEGALGRLGESQKALRDALKQFSEEMGEGRAPGGSDPGTAGRGGTEGAEDFDRAGEAMGEAGEALGRGEGAEALDAQTRALENLRQGARRLADQMMRRSGQGGRDGEEGDREDPLGRPRRNGGASLSDRVKVPEEIDVERARRILDDIRKRLGEPVRPKFERDYLDRLLDLDR